MEPLSYNSNGDLVYNVYIHNGYDMCQICDLL